MINRKTMDHLQTITIKTTYACNMACQYCYEDKNRNPKKVSIDHVKILLTKLRRHSIKPYNILWHGGEPLLMGIEFYKEALEIEKELGGTFINSIQTNGILLGDNEIDFLLRNNFRVGISLDGSKEIHDSNRTSIKGTGTFDKVWRNIEKFQSHPSYKRLGIIAVFTKKTAENIPSFYKFFHDNRLNFQLNTLLPTQNPKDTLAPSIVEYENGMINLFDRWIKEKEEPIIIHPFSDMVEAILSGKINICTLSGHCYDNFLCMDPYGYLMPCGKWPRDDYLFGHISSGELSTYYSSEPYFRYKGNHSRLIKECGDCEYFYICHGGCYYLRQLTEDLTGNPNYFCDANKALFKHMTNTIINHLTNKTSKIPG